MASLLNTLRGFQIPAWLNLPSAIITDTHARHSTAGETSLKALKKHHVYIAKAIIALLTIMLAALSVYAAFIATRDGHCQLRLAQWQYCEGLSEAGRDEACKAILAGAVPIRLGGCSGSLTRAELIISITGPYIQQYSRCGDWLLWGTPWWHNRGGLYTMGALRPIFWRFPDLYVVANYQRGIPGVICFLAGSLYWLFRRPSRGRKHVLAGMVCLITFSALEIFSWWILKAEADVEKTCWVHLSKDLTTTCPQARVEEHGWVVTALERFQEASFWDVFTPPTQGVGW
ncbi:hypothetical protein BKA56DRAFT_711127 [Ilyonectria sp. MPI-CAGE-AT-0026]|nr:hypothetical protein BKA56DRAFT_711127 [Ilyonectria sp. MPI-CAGE-AT-0026]